MCWLSGPQFQVHRSCVFYQATQSQNSRWSQLFIDILEMPVRQDQNPMRIEHDQFGNSTKETRVEHIGCKTSTHGPQLALHNCFAMDLSSPCTPKDIHVKESGCNSYVFFGAPNFNTHHLVGVFTNPGQLRAANVARSHRVGGSTPFLLSIVNPPGCQKTQLKLAIRKYTR